MVIYVNCRLKSLLCTDIYSAGFEESLRCIILTEYGSLLVSLCYKCPAVDSDSTNNGKLLELFESAASGGHTLQVVQVVRCTRAHDPWGPTSEDQITIFFEKINIKLFPTLPIVDAQLTSCVMPVPERSKSSSCFSVL